MPESRTPLIVDSVTGLTGVPNAGDWLDINERPWLRLSSDAVIGANDRVIVQQPATVTLTEPYSDVWIFNDTDGAVTIASEFQIGGVVSVPPGSLAIVAGDGSTWHGFLASPQQRFVTAIEPILTGSPDLLIGDYTSAAGLLSATRSVNRKPKLRGISFPPQLDETNGTLALSEDVFCIRDQIFSVLRTEKGERPLRQSFGLTDRTFEVRSGFGVILEEIRAELIRQIPELFDVTVSGIYQPVATLVLQIDWQLDERNIQPPLGFELAL